MKFFKPDSRNGPEDVRVAASVQLVLIAVGFGSLLNLVTALVLHWNLASMLGAICIAVTILSLLVARAGWSSKALVMALMSVVVVCCYSAYAQDGIRNIALPMLPVLVVIASLLLSRLILLVVTLFASIGLVLMMSLRWLVAGFPFDPGEAGDITIFVGTLILAAITGNMLSTRIRNGLEERQTMRDQLVQMQKMDSLGRLAGGVAHDFNNLLTVINGYAGMCLSKVGNDPKLVSYLTEIRTAGQHAAELTRALLTFSRKQVADTRPCNWNELVNDSRTIVTRLLGEDIVLRTDLASDLDLVAADPAALRQVLINLAVNARDAMPAGGHLTVQTSNVSVGDSDLARDPALRPGPYVSLSLSDTGVGMDSELRKHIFEPFFSTKDMGQGTGLGLSIVYGAVRQCNGTILLDTEPGRGAKFTVLIPRFRGAESAGAPDSPPALGSR